MVILRTRNKITDFLMISAWASPFKFIPVLFKVTGFGYFPGILVGRCLTSGSSHGGALDLRTLPCGKHSLTDCNAGTANTRCFYNAGLMLGQRRRRGPTLIQHCKNVSCLLGEPCVPSCIKICNIRSRIKIK